MNVCLSERLRVALICAEIPDYSLEFAEVAAERHDVDLFIADKFKLPARDSLPASLTVRSVTFPRQRQVLSGVFAIRALAEAIKSTKPDLVHILADGNIWCVALGLLLGAYPVMTTVHDAEYHPGDTASQRVPKKLLDLLRSRSSALLVHGENVRSSLVRQLPQCRDRVFCFPHVPLNNFHKTAVERGYAKPPGAEKRALFFGRICDYKGLDYFLDAAQRVCAITPDVKFVVAGSGSIEKYRNRLAALGDRVEVLNRFITHEEASRLFAEADVLGLPYIEASQSGVLMMAMPYGLPVVASDVGDLSATVKATQCGLVVPARDTQALADAMRRILQDDTLRQQLASAADAAMVGRFSTRMLAGELSQHYEQVVKAARFRSERAVAAT